METVFYRGGKRDQDGNWQESELPDVATGFTIMLDHENLPERNTILRRIFKTVSPCFQPFLLPMGKTETITDVRRWITEINGLLELHGLSQIRVCLAEKETEQ